MAQAAPAWPLALLVTAMALAERKRLAVAP
jgi:hypothetical protein